MEQPPVRFRALSLNCWGIAVPGFQSKLRKERMAAIAQHVHDAGYEVVAFQEVWDQDDFAGMCLKLGAKLPFNHYFYSGFTGSGVCVFSKFPILETLWHAYPMNGYAHKFQHGDWYGAKGVGLCKMQIGQMLVHLYATHVHARYSFDESEDYHAHRTTQMLNLAQFVRHTSDACDAVLLCGDLNTEDGELGYQLLRSQAVLKDAWAEKNAKFGESSTARGETSETPDNPFTNQATLKHRPNGTRIDFVMYRHNAQVELICTQCEVAMGLVPGESYCYSDHSAVLASFLLRRNVTARQQPDADRAGQIECLRRTGRLLDDAQRQCRHHRARHAVFAILWLIILVLVREQFLGSNIWHVLSEVMQVVAAVMAAACGWNALVVLRVDSNSLRQHKLDVINLQNVDKYLVEQPQRQVSSD